MHVKMHAVRVCLFAMLSEDKLSSRSLSVLCWSQPTDNQCWVEIHPLRSYCDCKTSLAIAIRKLGVKWFVIYKSWNYVSHLGPHSKVMWRNREWGSKREGLGFWGLSLLVNLKQKRGLTCKKRKKQAAQMVSYQSNRDL